MDNLLGKLNDAIEHCEDTDILDVNMKLSYAELNYLRRLVLTDEYSQSLSVDNLRRARKLDKN